MNSDGKLSAFAERLNGEILRGGSVHSGSDPMRTDSAFNELALELFKLQFSANSPYRRFCESRGAEPSGFWDWRNIPAMPAEAFKEYEMTSIPEPERTTVFHSSGTTGQRPSRHFHSKGSLELYESSLWPWFSHHLCPPPRVRPEWLLALTPQKENAPNSSLAHMFQCVAERLNVAPALFGGRTAPDGGWELEAPSVISFLEQASSSGKPGLLLSPAFGLVQLFDALAERKQRFQLAQGSSVLETGGYKGRTRTLSKADLHAEITRWLGVPPTCIVTEYGMSELSSQAYDQVAGSSLSRGPRVFRFPSWARAQIISPETGAEVADGETGMIRVFDLANVFSVLALQTGDLGVRRGEGFNLLGRAEHLEPRGCSLLAIP